MKKNLSEIRDNLKFYAVDRITCFEHPVGIILENYQRYYGSYTYMFIKIVQAYNFSPKVLSEDMVIQFWNDYLGIDVLRIPHQLDIFKVIKEKIDNNLPALVIGNLIELFYSDKYMKKNWGHLFLITGYDEEKELFFILDDTQLKENAKYEPFAVTFDIMNKMMKEVAWFQSNEMIFTLEKKLYFKPKNDKEILIFLLKLVCKSIGECDYKEVEHLSTLHELILTLENDSEKTDYYIEVATWNFVNVIKKKEVLIDELTIQMKRFDYPEDKIDMLINAKENLHYIWEKFCNRELVKCLRKKKDYKPIIPDEIYTYENELKLQIQQCINYIEKHDFESEVNTVEYATENNESGIINIKTDILHFCFNDNKIYNSWFSDECPKLFLGQQINCSKKYRMIATILIDEDYLETYFQVGLFVRNNNEVYYGAIDNCNKLVFDIWGSSNLDSIYNFRSMSTLYLEYSDGNIDFGIIEDDNVLRKLYRPFSPTGYLDMGIACKTWGNGMFLDIQIKDFKIEEI